MPHYYNLCWQSVTSLVHLTHHSLINAKDNAKPKVFSNFHFIGQSTEISQLTWIATHIIHCRSYSSSIDQEQNFPHRLADLHIESLKSFMLNLSSERPLIFQRSLTRCATDGCHTRFLVISSRIFLIIFPDAHEIDEGGHKGCLLVLLFQCYILAIYPRTFRIMSKCICSQYEGLREYHKKSRYPEIGKCALHWPQSYSSIINSL